MADIDEAKVRAEFEALALSGYFCLKFCPTRIDWTKGNSPVAVDDLGKSSLIHEWIGYLARARHDAAEIAALKARIAELEAGGEPVAWRAYGAGHWNDGLPNRQSIDYYGDAIQYAYGSPPAPKLAVPEGWQLVPKRVTPAMEDAYCSTFDVYDSAQELHDAVLAAAPEQKP